MSINIGDKPEFNVVNVGDELTTDQLAALQNAQGASATNPCLTRTNTFNTTDTAVRITQDGTGNAFEVFDVSGDTTPFQINASGQVGVTGPILGGASLSVTGPVSVVGNSTFTGATSCSTSSTTPLSVSVTNTNSGVTGVFVDYRGTGDAVRITNTGTGASLLVEDETNPDSTPFLISASGDVAIGASTPNGKLRVTGRSYFENTSGGGGNAVLWARSTGSTSVPVGQIMADTAHTGPALVVDLLRTTSTSNALTVNNEGTASIAVFTNTANSTSDAVRITNLGSGNSFVVEDSANPDSSPFAITATGNVGIGTGIPTSKLQVQGGGVTFVNGSPSANYFGLVTSHTGVGLTLSNGATNSSELIGATALGTGSIAVFTNTATATADAVRITNLGTGNSFVVEDSTNPDSTPFVIDNAGRVAIGASSAGANALLVSSTAGKASFNGGAAVAGNLECVTVLVSNRIDISTSTTTTPAFLISQSGAAEAVRITNTGTGDSFVVEDSTNPDSSPFVIDASGSVVIGGTAPVSGYKLDVRGSIRSFASSGGSIFDASGSAVPLTINNTGTGNSFVVNDESNDTTPFVIDNAGNVTLGGSLTLAAEAYAANASLVIDNTNYPHELEFKVGTTTYRVPARAI